MIAKYFITVKFLKLLNLRIDKVLDTDLMCIISSSAQCSN